MNMEAILSECCMYLMLPKSAFFIKTKPFMPSDINLYFCNCISQVLWIK